MKMEGGFLRYCRSHCAKLNESKEQVKFGPAESANNNERRKSADDLQENKTCKSKVLEVLGELNVFYSERLTRWREAVKECSTMLEKCPLEGGVEQHATTSVTQINSLTTSDFHRDILMRVEKDLENLMDNLAGIISQLNRVVLRLSAKESLGPTAVISGFKATETSLQYKDKQNHHLNYNPIEDVQNPAVTYPDTEQTADSGVKEANENEKQQEKSQVDDISEQTHCCQISSEEGPNNESYKTNTEEKDKETCEWISVRPALGDRIEENHFEAQDKSFIRTSAPAAAVLRCEMADSFSSLMVSDSEELVSRVIHIKVQDRAELRFPLTVAVPFHVRHRSSYRDVVVKIMDEDQRVSYITPMTTEGVYGGQKSSFAEVKVYTLGLFAVVSCLKKESYTIPKKGFSLKLSVDPRICLNYQPGSFTAPVMAQIMIQPVDAALLTTVKSRNEAYKAVVSTSPLVYFTHPISQTLRRPVTVTLPCPPNPEKQRDKSLQDKQDLLCRSVPSDNVRILNATIKSKGTFSESLIVLAAKNKEWRVLDQVSTRSQQKGLVSFDLMEIFDRLLVVRLLSPMEPCQLTSLAEELEESTRLYAVTILLQRRLDDPHTVLMLAMPSKDLSWELSKLEARGYTGLAETSAEITMCEADRLFLRFSGNISSTDFNQNSKSDQLTFHNQRRNHLLVHLTEVDPFGNYSSPHYKGTAMFYRVSRNQLDWNEDTTVLKDGKLIGDPVCKLPLTLPKKVRSISRPTAARVKTCEETDSLPDALLHWLSEELSQEDVSLLISCLRLRRSAAQLVKLQAGSSPSAQAFHVLIMWRRTLPAVSQQLKVNQLAQCLSKSGRADLAGELLLRHTELAEKRKIKN